MLFKFASVLVVLASCACAAAVPAVPAANLADTSTHHARLAKFGLKAIPSFDNEAVAWSHSFDVVEEGGAVWNVQVPRVYRNNQFDSFASQQKFFEVFIEGAHTDLWKQYAMQLDANDGQTADGIVKRDFAAFLSLDYCNGHGKCTGFSLHYNGDGCQAAPGTNYVQVYYSQNASFIAWNKGGCTGRRTLFANGCNGGSEQVRDETPGTNSFTFHVGCSF